MKYVYEPGKFRSLSQSEMGKALWAFLCEPESRLRMELASDLRHPAVEGIDRQLSVRFDASVLRDADRLKQMIGHMTRQLMEQCGFELDQQRVNLRTGVIFSTGSRYRRRLSSEIRRPGRNKGVARSTDRVPL